MRSFNRRPLSASLIMGCTIIAVIAMSCSCAAFTKQSLSVHHQKIPEKNPALTQLHAIDHRNYRRQPEQHNDQRTITMIDNFDPPIRHFIIGTVSTITILMTAICLPHFAMAGLLDDYGTGLTINPPTTTTNIRSDKSATDSTTATTTVSGGNGVQIDPTLRGSYYYPTAKKRYLPRILKASDALDILPEEVIIATKSNSDDAINWDRLLDLVAMVDDAVLPLQLYQSSLTGQGLSLNNDYATNMKAAALRYERSAKQLASIFQISNKNKNAASVKSTVAKAETQEKVQILLVELKDAMKEYRVQGRLTNNDNINIPSATPEEMRRMAMRNRNIIQASDQ